MSKNVLDRKELELKLIRCYIANFGKLHEFNYEFRSGLNIINEENGFGKTTFATFIKSMFYGLDVGTNVKTENSERKRYMPWQGGLFGGNIEFEINDKRYKIERFFGKKQAEDTFKLYDLTTNLESTDYTENIGEEIFKINKSGYERSTYIPQGKIQIDMEDSLSAKLGNILESDNDINTSEEALNQLSAAKKIYQKDRGKGGLIDEKKEKLNFLQRKLENSKFDVENLEAKTNKLNELNSEIRKQEDLREKNQKILSEKIEEDRKIAKLETYKAIVEKCIHAKEKLTELENFFENGIPYKFKENKINNNEIDETIRNCYNLLDIEKELQIKNQEKEEIKSEIKKNKILNLILLFLSCIFLVMGIILIVTKLQQMIGIIGITTGVILLGLYFILLHKSKNKQLVNINKKIQEIEADKQEVETEINTVLKKFELGNEDRIIELTNLKAEYNSYNDLLKLKEKEYTLAKEQFENSKKQKEQFELENDMEKLQDIKDLSNLSEEQLKTEISGINKELDTLIDSKNQIKNQIEILENQIDENEYIETDIENLKDEIEMLSNKYKTLKKTEELLRTAKESFSSMYLKDMSDGFNHYLKVINNKEFKTNVDINLGNGSQKEIKYFSSGYRDLIYICMRFSLIQALFKNEHPFVILDDPFVNLDEEKTLKALEVLNEFAKQYQIIYFVCNSSRLLKS